MERLAKKPGNIKKMRRYSKQRIGESGVAGVYRSHARAKGWTGHILHNGLRFSIGNWATVKEAAHARAELYFSLCGEYPLDVVSPIEYSKATEGEINGDTPLARADKFISKLINLAT